MQARHLLLCIGATLVCPAAWAVPEELEVRYDFSERDQWRVAFCDGQGGAVDEGRVKVDLGRDGARLEVDFRGAPESSYACLAVPSPCGGKLRPAFDLPTETSFIAEIHYQNLTGASLLGFAWQREGRNRGLSEKPLFHSADPTVAIVDVYDPAANGGRPCQEISGIHLHLRPTRVAEIEKVWIERVAIHPPGPDDFAGMTRDYREAADAALLQTQNMPPAQAGPVRNRVEELRDTLSGFQRRMNMGTRLPASGVDEYRKRLDQELAAIRAAVDAAGVGHAVAAGGGDLGYVVHCASALEKVFRDKPPVGEPFGTAHLRSAQGEYESFQLLIAAGDERLKGVRVSVSDLQSTAGTMVPSSSIEVLRVGYVKTAQSTPGGGPAGWWADPLFPNAPFAVEPDTVQPLFITVYTPRSAEPGDYSGEVTIQPEGRPEARIPVALHVFGFALPERRHLKAPLAACTMLDNYVSAFDSFYPKERYPRDPLLKRFYSFMLEHDVDPSRVGLRHLRVEGGNGTPAQLDFTAAEPFVRYCVDRGLTCLDVYGQGMGKPYGRPWLDAWGAFLERNGWRDLAFAYVQDEPQPDAYSEVAGRAAEIREGLPRIPRMCTVPPVPQLVGSIDLWCPLTPSVSTQTIAERHAEGEGVWWYVCIGPKKPAANFFIDYPATDHRALFWLTFKYGLDGFLYYAMDTWQIHAKNYPIATPDFAPAAEGTAWGLPHWNPLTWGDGNGDGLLMYPGPDGPWASLRLKVIRDGIEDYEYLALLRELTAEVQRSSPGGTEEVLLSRCRRVLSVGDAVARDVEHYTDKPEAILAARDEVAGLIEAATKALEQSSRSRTTR